MWKREANWIICLSGLFFPALSGLFRDMGCFAQRQVRAAEKPAFLFPSWWQEDQQSQYLILAHVSTPPTSVRPLQTTTRPRKGAEFPGLQNNVYWNVPSSPLNTMAPSQIWEIPFGTVHQEDSGRLFTAVCGGRRRNCRYKFRWDIQTGYKNNLRGKNSMKMLQLSLPCS